MTQVTAEQEAVTIRRGYSWWRLLVRDPVALMAVVWLLFLAVCVLVGPELFGT